MYVGGTNFGYWSGSNTGSPIDTYDITSYDYDAPLSESGDTTWKYFLIKDTVSKYLPPPTEPVPKNSTKTSLRNVKLDFKGGLLSNLDYLANASSYQHSRYPMTMEQLGFNYGFVLYQSALTKAYPADAKLEFDYNGIGDRVTVLVMTSQNFSSAVYLGTVDNMNNDSVSITLHRSLKSDQELLLIVENRGRVNFAREMQNQTKGIRGNVTLNGE